MKEKYSPLAESISKLKAKKKLKIHAHVTTNSSGGFDDDYEKKEADSLKAQIKALEKHKASLTPDKALSHMHSALDAELMQKKGRHMQLQGRISK